MNTPTHRDVTAQGLHWSRKTVLDLLGGFPPDRMLYRPGPADCHALWIMGHIALSDAWILNMITGDKKTLGEEWRAFGYQTDLTENACDYPPLDEVREQLGHQRERLLTWLAGASEADLFAPLDDGGIGFAATPLEAINKEIWHEGWHSGQLSTLRRAVGLGPALFPNA